VVSFAVARLAGDPPQGWRPTTCAPHRSGPAVTACGPPWPKGALRSPLGAWDGLAVAG